MEDRAFLAVILIPVFLILASLIAGYNLPPNVLADNATQTVNRINITLIIETCRGSVLKEGDVLPHVTVVYNGSTVLDSSCTTCKLENVTEGTYLVRVKWRGSLVYDKNLTFTASNSTAEIPTKTTKFSVTVLNDEEEPITYRVSIKISGDTLTLSPSNGKAVILPFGDYLVEASYSWTCKIVVKKTVRVNVDCDNTGYRVILPVAAQVTVRFTKPDGSRALGVNGNATIYASNGKKADSIDLRQRDTIIFTNMPYGKYKVVVTVKGKTVVSEDFEVKSGGKREFVYSIPILDSVKITFLDAENNPIPLLPVVVETPLGDELKLGTNSAGEVSIQQALVGEYTVTVRWQGLTLRKTVKISSGSATVNLPLRKTVLLVKPKSSYALPKGIRLKVVLQRTGYVVKEEVLPQEKPQWSVNLGFLVTEAGYEASLEYLNTTWTSIYTPSTSGTWTIEVPIYDLQIRVKTLTGEALVGCNLTARYDGVTKTYKLSAEGVSLKQVPDVDVALLVSCSGTPVFQGEVRPGRVINGSIVLRAYVTDLRIRVKGWFSRPLAGANITLVVEGAGHRLRFTSLSDSNGYTVFRNVPVPPGSSVKAMVRYKNQALTLLVDPRKTSETVFLDVFLDTPLGVLSFESTLILSAVIGVSSLVTVILYRRYRYVKDIEGLLVPEDYFYYEAGASREGLGEEGIIEKVKEFIKELLGRGEEEEGETFFG